MTAPLHRLEFGALAAVTAGHEVVVDGAEGHHAVTVRRLRVGHEVLLADGTGALASGVVERVEPGCMVVRVTSMSREEAAGPRFVLVQALAKGGRDEQAVESATELGADAVVAWQAARCIVRWRGDRAAKSLDKWRSVAASASKQARRAVVPDVEGPVTTPELAQRARSAALTLVLHEDADLPLAGMTLPSAGDVLVVVGPEGGIAPEEVGRLTEAGATAVRLGATVLRSSSAGPAALAVLSAQGRWR